MQQPKKGLSVVVITLNEEANLGRCLESVKDIADEIIVVDSLSVDRTKEIALSYNAVFIEQAFLGYVEQKNFALAKANCEYILSLDADEALNKQLADFIAAEKKNGFSNTAYRFNRMTNYCGQWIKHGTWYPDRKIRLVKAGTYLWRGDNLHERFEAIGDDKDVKNVPLDMLHYSFVSYSDHVLRTDNYTNIAAKAMYQRGRKPSYFKIIVNPAWAFFYCFIIRRGFLDGWNGYLIARMVALNTFLKYFKLVEQHRIHAKK